VALRPIPRPKAPRAGRPGGRFTQHRRLDRLRETLESHPAGLSLEDLGSLLHVTTRSVRRYLHELGLVTELESVETRPGGVHLWRIKPSERGRTVALRRTQAYGLLAPRRLFDVMKGSALFDELDLVWRQVLLIAQRPTAKKETTDAHLEDRFLYVPSTPHAYASRAEELDELFRAVADLRVLRFRHRPRGGERSERVIAHPYAMVLHRGAIWCLARAAEEVRAFQLDRMESVEASESERFELPADFDLAEYVHGEFGVGPRTRDQGTRVVVEFEPRAAEEVRSRRFHPTQKVGTAPDGRVRLSITVPDVEPVKAWLLGFGAGARVIEPPELAAEMVRELRRSLARYGALR
jgi:predicted DNA-binding transcriptional regulator YafY